MVRGDWYSASRLVREVDGVNSSSKKGFRPFEETQKDPPDVALVATRYGILKSQLETIARLETKHEGMVPAQQISRTRFPLV